MVLDQDEKLLPDNLEYSHNWFAGGCMEIIERSYIVAIFRVVIIKNYIAASQAVLWGTLSR